MIRLQAGTYELVEENRNGWNQEAFKERYSDILDKYDYIVGDWGYGQLRLRGFYDNSNRKVPFEQKIATLDEYLQEFCNFGCPYFVIKKVKAATIGDEPIDPSGEIEIIDLTVDTGARSDSVQRYDRHGFQDRKERNRQYNQRQENQRQERNERNSSSNDRNGKQDRSDKNGKSMRSEQSPRVEKGKEDRGSKDRRGEQFRRDKVSAGTSATQFNKGEKRE